MTLHDLSTFFEYIKKEFPEFMSILFALLIALGANITETASQIYKNKKIDVKKKIAEVIIVTSIVSLIYYIDSIEKIPLVPIIYYLAWVFGVKAYEWIKEVWFATFMGTMRTILQGMLRYFTPPKVDPPPEKKVKEDQYQESEI